MLHARDSFLKYFEARLGPTGWKLNTQGEAPLPPNAVTVIFLTTSPQVRVDPGVNYMVVSIDCLADGTETDTASRAVWKMAMDVDKALSGKWIPKKDWSDPANPKDLGTTVSWRPWGPWRRVPDPSERCAHLNRTLSLLYIGEKV